MALKKIMIVDDSFFMRKALERICLSAGDLVICGAYASGEAALEQLDVVHPDLITMDVEMPGMGGLEAVRAIMARRHVPILMLSSLTARGADVTLRALEYGAADFVAKPAGGMAEIGTISGEIVEKIRALTRGIPSLGAPRLAVRAVPAHTAPAAGALLPNPRSRPGAVECVAIGISTGGPAALAHVFSQLPASINVPILVVQHMPAGFTKPLAERLNSHCALEVVEAEEGMLVQPGRIMIGVAGKQFRLRRSSAGVVARLDADGVNVLYSPSADLLFHSLAEIYGRTGLAVIMTGMGSDGSEGLAELKRRGGFVLGQDAASSTVYGMPRAAAEAGLVDRVVALDDMAAALTEVCRKSALRS